MVLAHEGKENDGGGRDLGMEMVCATMRGGGEEESETGMDLV